MNERKTRVYTLAGKQFGSGRPQNESRDFHGAALLDERGREIPMTAKMIDDALQQAQDFLSPELLPQSLRAC